MDDSSDLNALRFDQLSTREREVLDLAVLGRTDEQIAQELGLSVSTISSYWVRIRGKLGQLSRTELVADLLHHDSDLRFADLLAENARLQAEGSRTRKDLATAERNLRNAQSGGWHLHALDHITDATFVCRSPGEIVYANLQAEHLFAAEPGELERLSVWELTVTEEREARRQAVAAFFDPSTPPRMVAGVERPYYARRLDGTNFRGILVAERFLAPEGVMSTVTVRAYLNEVEVLIRHLRRPFELM